MKTKELQQLLIKEGFLSKGEDDGVFGPKTKQAYINYLNSLNKSKQFKNMRFVDYQKLENEINKGTNEDIIHFTNLKTNTPYIIDDKKNNKLSVYYNGQLLGQFNAIHGKHSTTFGNTFKKKVKTNTEHIVKTGDIFGLIAKNNGITVDELLKLNPQIKNPHLIKPGQKINLPGYKFETTEIDPDEATITYVDENGKLINLGGNLTTPAGVYFTTRAQRDYSGAPSFIRRTINQVQQNSYAGIPASIHARTIKENSNTNGCTGMSKEDLETLAKLTEGYENIPTYILPANDKNKFKIRNGQLTFVSHDNSKTPSFVPKVYTPIKRIKWNTSGKTKEQSDIIRQFSLGLMNNKKQLMQDLKINDDTYNQLAKYCLGILGVESSYGKTNNFIENLGKAFLKKTSLSETGPDYKSEYETYGQTSDNNSVGLTQIRYKYLSDKSKQLFDKYGISKDDLINDPSKAAVATMIRLTDEYLNRGMNFDNAIKSWNSRPGYVERVKKADQTFTIESNYKL